MTRTRRSHITTLGILLASATLLATGCAGRVEARPPEVLNKLPPERGPLVNSVGSDGVAKDGRDDGAVAEESCTENDQGAWDCTWDDGETSCTYGYDAAGVLTYQQCQGSWGTYDCTNTGAEISCVWTSESGSCTDVYGLDYELISSDCGPAMYFPEEDCVTREDGSVTCVYDDGGVLCEYGFDASGAFVSQSCTDGTWTYACLAEAEIIVCDLSSEGELLCSDTYDAQGNPVEMGCEAYYEEPEQPVDEECTPQDDGTTLCSFTDGEWSCSYGYDAQGQPLFQDCDSADGTMSYDCAVDATDGLFHCVYVQGEESCEEVYDLTTGEPVSSTCVEAGEDRG